MKLHLFNSVNLNTLSLSCRIRLAPLPICCCPWSIVNGAGISSILKHPHQLRLTALLVVSLDLASGIPTLSHRAKPAFLSINSSILESALELRLCLHQDPFGAFMWGLQPYHGAKSQLLSMAFSSLQNQYVGEAHTSFTKFKGNMRFSLDPFWSTFLRTLCINVFFTLYCPQLLSHPPLTTIHCPSPA